MEYYLNRKPYDKNDFGHIISVEMKIGNNNYMTDPIILPNPSQLKSVVSKCINGIINTKY